MSNPAVFVKICSHDRSRIEAYDAKRFYLWQRVFINTVASASVNGDVVIVTFTNGRTEFYCARTNSYQGCII